MSAQSLLTVIRHLGGIDAREIRDITGESRAGRGVKGIPPGLFRKRGAGLDDLATQLRDYGFCIDLAAVDGGIQELRDLIRQELDGEKVYSAADSEARWEAERDLEAAQYEALATIPAAIKPKCRPAMILPAGPSIVELIERAIQIRGERAPDQQAA